MQLLHHLAPGLLRDNQRLDALLDEREQGARRLALEDDERELVVPRLGRRSGQVLVLEVLPVRHRRLAH